eukprot:CAMPEP_0113640852 /NCGR_PEP_ID=MMETSP0017_2-20120614/21441_1 /TAXON_ID=2856 /ORGANISM="Cylindrotheca closterium" /LENGTH=70 /DNA_ID=CAMNT_0000552155 /DNA_START=53 /DNA_END=265 /DNA_ORIENTATION=+ /assembly_acc=CAM_ASM_000147
MKLSIIAVMLLPALSAAFSPSQPRAFNTALEGAKSYEEDLEMTRQVIATFNDEPAEEKKEEKKEEEPKEE